MSLYSNIFSYPFNKWILWVGAGISSSEPSSLPLGWQLTKFALENNCGSEIQTKIFNIWDNANKLLATSSNKMPINQIPRLESILGEISDVQENLRNSTYNFMDGFKAFTKTPYNQNHYYLAKLLLKGVTIVTTNFDLCIQNAYNDILQKEDDLVQHRSGSLYYYKSRSNKHCGKLWHIHGIAEDLKTLGATIKIIKEGLPYNIQQFLDHSLDNSSVLVFLGYSLSDSFDVNLYFLKKNTFQYKNSLAVFLQHGKSPYPIISNLIMKCFGNSIRYSTDTSDFLKKLSGDNNRLKFNHNKFNWEASFLNEANLIEIDKIKDILLCKLSNMLGLSIDILKPSAYDNAQASSYYFDKEDFHKTMAIVCRMKGNTFEEKQHDLKANYIPDLRGYFYAQGKFRKALKYSKSVSELFEDATNNEIELRWDTYTSMSIHCRKLTYKYLKPYIFYISAKDRIILKKLIELTNLLGNKPLKNVKYINQVASALRFNFIFRALTYNDDTTKIKEKALNLYGEGASILGYIGTYRDIAIEQFFLTKYHKVNDRFSNAILYAKKSLELAKLVGDVAGKSRAKKLLNIFKIHKVIYFILKMN